MHQFPKIGILGGGQLGKMMAMAVSKWHLQLDFLDKSADFPAGLLACSFVEGDFSNYKDVVQFGQDKDVITVEIEHVNTDALRALKEDGKIVHPDPDKLALIKDKGLQKQFYRDHFIPTSEFGLYEDKADVMKSIRNGRIQYPFVQKSRTAGYDGKGVVVINSAREQDNIMDVPSVIEKKVRIVKELSVIVARSASGEVKTYPVVEMEFNPTANLVEFLVCPANIDDMTRQKATLLAIDVAEKLDIVGLLAIEEFLTEDNKILINEVAPRPHNSGHHSIESCYTSQFEQHIRAILGWPLGSTELISPSVMVNLLGHPAFRGRAFYEGFEKTLKMQGVHVHIYGKKETKPFRKMGHITITSNTTHEARRIAKKVKEEILVISK